MKQALFARIASLVKAIENCQETGNTEWECKHRDTLEKLVRDHLPHGSGFDSGTKFLWEHSTPEKLVFRVDFHHMDENGFYDGWSEHVVTVQASLWAGIVIRVSGRNRNGIKDYMSELFHHCATIETEA